MVPRILIVDDELPARTRMTMLLADIEQACPHLLVAAVGSASEALAGLAAWQPDIVLLDVQMPGTTGLELAAQLRAAVSTPLAIIFISAHEGFALKAFEVQAWDYLLKPVRAERLADAITRAVTRLSGAAPAQSRKHFSVIERDRHLLVPLDEVLYLKAEQKYVTVRTASHVWLIEEALLSLEQEFAHSFIRVHRNALVAHSAILGVERGPTEDGAESWQVILRGLDERLPISRRQWPLVKALIAPGN
jgi:two-component system response regulator AlgR